MTPPTSTANVSTSPNSAPRRIVWVYRSAMRDTASTVMRGEQLSGLARDRLEGVDVGYIDETSLDGVRNAVVILTKSFLKKVTLRDCEGLKSRGNVICVDYVDDKSRADLDPFVDIYIASSVAQLAQFETAHPGKTVHMITHHTDPRIANITVPSDRCRIGYFGEFANVRYRFRLRGKVEFNRVDTNPLDRSDRTWIDRLGQVNVHYAVRRRRRFDGDKPFLKGFTAAACGANIIVPRGESDALHYLSPDYPYLLQDDRLTSVKDMIRHVHESFGSEDWQRGLEIMRSVAARCSSDQVVRDLKALLALL